MIGSGGCGGGGGRGGIRRRNSNMAVLAGGGARQVVVPGSRMARLTRATSEQQQRTWGVVGWGVVCSVVRSVV